MVIKKDSLKHEIIFDSCIDAPKKVNVKKSIDGKY